MRVCDYKKNYTFNNLFKIFYLLLYLAFSEDISVAAHSIIEDDIKLS